MEGPAKRGPPRPIPFMVWDEDLDGPVIRTLNGHVREGGHDRDVWDAWNEGLGGDGLWRASRSGVLYGPSPFMLSVPKICFEFQRMNNLHA